eukprot:7898561-Pyramimonas_sp.AAC.1
MSLRQQRYDIMTGQMGFVEAPGLFAEPATEAVHIGPHAVPAQESGARFLISKILEEYTTDRQDLQWEVLTAFFDFYCGNSKFGNYLAL